MISVTCAVVVRFVGIALLNLKKPPVMTTMNLFPFTFFGSGPVYPLKQVPERPSERGIVVSFDASDVVNVSYT